MTVMKFKNDCIGRILTTFGCSSPQYFRLRVFGTKGTIVNNVLFKGEAMDRITWSRPWEWSRKKEKLIEWMIDRFRLYRFREYPFYVYEHSASCIDTVQDFVTAVIEGKRPASDVHDGVNSVVLSIRGTESYRQSKAIACSEPAQE